MDPNKYYPLHLIVEHIAERRGVSKTVVEDEIGYVLTHHPSVLPRMWGKMVNKKGIEVKGDKFLLKPFLEQDIMSLTTAVRGPLNEEGFQAKDEKKMSWEEWQKRRDQHPVLKHKRLPY